ncbi:MAG: hypothetical protein C4550_03450 [Nitrospiraceae bacterium]|nr:MAG: hypothetical protein C4550_03450 [Nitrospiraceae bacterium]
MRFTYNFLILLTVLILMLFSCVAKQSIVTSEYIEQQMLGIDYSNGINEKEAIVLAQNYLFKNPPDKSTNPAKTDVDINRFNVREFEDRFNIKFDFKFDNGKPFMYPFFWSVIVDKNTGQILSSGFAGHK